MSTRVAFLRAARQLAPAVVHIEVGDAEAEADPAKLPSITEPQVRGDRRGAAVLSRR